MADLPMELIDPPGIRQVLARDLDGPPPVVPMGFVTTATHPDLAAVWRANIFLAGATNATRAHYGRRPLEYDPRLAGAAFAQAADCVLAGRLSHVGRDGSWPWDRITAHHYDWSRCSENAAWAGWEMDAQEAVNSWFHSPPHRQNLLGDFRHMGCACLSDGHGGVYWICCYAAPR